MAQLTARMGRAVIEAVVSSAEEMGVRSNVAVVDAGCDLVAFLRMDGALLGSIDVAMRKARTAGLFGMATGDLGALSGDAGPLRGIELTNGGLVTFGGGEPLRDADGTVIGGVGVSGSTVEDDSKLAQVGADAIAHAPVGGRR